jgi:hypothetical protein
MRTVMKCNIVGLPDFLGSYCLNGIVAGYIGYITGS